MTDAFVSDDVRGSHAMTECVKIGLREGLLAKSPRFSLIHEESFKKGMYER